MALLRLLRVRSTSDKILQVYMRENNDSDDGIYINVFDRDSPSSVTPGVGIVGTLIIRRSDIFPNESVTSIVLDSNHIENPTAYIITLCFSTYDNNTSKLYMGRVAISTGGITWTQCADSPKTYNDSEILNIFSSFFNDGTPIKTLTIRNADGSTIIKPERH